MTEPQTQCIRIPLREEHVDEFVAFTSDLRTRPEELAAVLREEGILAEAVFLERSPEGASIVLFTKATDLVAANAAFRASTHPIQVRMRELSARAFDVERATALEVLLDAT